MVEPVTDIGGKQRLGHRLRPVQKQVVVVEHVLFLLGADVSREQFAQLGGPAGAPWIVRAQHLFEAGLGVDAARIDRQAGALGRKPGLGLRETEFVAHQIHLVGGVLAVVDRKRRIEPDLFGIVAQEARADAMEGAGPVQRIGHHASVCPHHLSRDAFDAAAHLGRRAARKRHQQDAARIGAVDDQMRDAVRQRIGLAGAGSGDHQQRAGRRSIARQHAMFHSAALFRIQGVEIGGGCKQGIIRGDESRSLIPALFAMVGIGGPASQLSSPRKRGPIHAGKAVQAP